MPMPKNDADTKKADSGKRENRMPMMPTFKIPASH